MWYQLNMSLPQSVPGRLSVCSAQTHFLLRRTPGPHKLVTLAAPQSKVWGRVEVATCYLRVFLHRPDTAPAETRSWLLTLI